MAAWNGCCGGGAGGCWAYDRNRRGGDGEGRATFMAVANHPASPGEVTDNLDSREVPMPVFLLVTAVAVILSVNSFTVKPTLKPAEYDQFESVSTAAGRAALTGRRWFAHAITSRR